MSPVKLLYDCMTTAKWRYECNIMWLQWFDVHEVAYIILHDSSNFTYVTTITLTWLLWYFVTKFILHFIQAKSLTLPFIKIMTYVGSFKSNCSLRVENLSLSQKNTWKCIAKSTRTYFMFGKNCLKFIKNFLSKDELPFIISLL